MITGQSTTVMISDFSFKPGCVNVAVGTKVTFTNEDGVAHTATDSSSGGFDSGNLNKGQTYTQTFTKAGTYSYICTIHQYMHGTVVVR
jgi:plastocyanin